MEKEKRRDKGCWNLNEEKRVENLKIKRAKQMDIKNQKEEAKEKEQVEKEYEEWTNSQPYFGMKKTKKLKEEMAATEDLWNQRRNLD